MLAVGRSVSLVVAAAAITGAAPAAAQTGPALVYTGPADGAVPRAVRERLALFARERGLGLVDLARAQEPPPRARERLTRGTAAYHAFRYAEAVAALEQAVIEVEAAGGADLERRELADLFLYRALSATETGDAETARDNLVRAAVTYPSYPIDKARFRPSLVTAYERARDAVLAVAAAEVELGFPDSCEVRLDGGEVSAAATVSLRPGRHLLRARCAGMEEFSASPSFGAGRQSYRPALRARPTPASRALAETDPTPKVIWVDADAAGAVSCALLDRATGRAVRRWRVRLESAANADRLDPILVSVIEREFSAPAPEPVVVERTRTPPLHRQPWFWVAVGAVAVSAVAVPLALTRADEVSSWGVSLNPGDLR